MQTFSRYIFKKGQFLKLELARKGRYSFVSEACLW